MNRLYSYVFSAMGSLEFRRRTSTTSSPTTPLISMKPIRPAKRGRRRCRPWRSTAAGPGVARRNGFAPMGEPPQPRQFRSCAAGARRAGSGRYSIPAAVVVRSDADRACRRSGDLRPRNHRHRITAKSHQSRALRHRFRNGFTRRSRHRTDRRQRRMRCPAATRAQRRGENPGRVRAAALSPGQAGAQFHFGDEQ